MAQILIRNLDDAIVERLRARADANGRSLEAEMRYILEQSAKVDMAKVNVAKVDMATARQHVMEIRKKLAGRKFPDTVELIREDRDR